MPTTAPVPTVDRLTDLTRLLEAAEGFGAVVAALRAGHSGAVDGAWGSSAGLTAAALGLLAPRTLLVVIAHPGDLDAWSDDLASFTGQRPAVFPAWAGRPGERLALDEVAGQRLRVLQQLHAPGPPRLVLTTVSALMQPVPPPAELARRRRTLRVGETVDPEELARWLVDHGYRRVDAVELPCEFSRRGGILDVYPPDADAPLRVEWFGDEVESIRRFSAQTQRSLSDAPAVEILGVTGHEPVSRDAQRSTADGESPWRDTGHLADHLPAGSWVALVEPDDLSEQGKHYLERVDSTAGLFTIPGTFQQLLRFPNVTVTALPRPTVEAACHLRVESVERFSGHVAHLRDELDGVAVRDRVLIACPTEAECRRLGEVLAAGRLAQSDRLRLLTGRVRAGFRMVEAGVVVLGSQELFHRDIDSPGVHAPGPPGPGSPGAPRRRIEARAIDSFLELTEGDFVVHVSHGIARYRGMQMLAREQAAGGRQQGKPGEGDGASSLLPAPRSLLPAEEHLVLEFRDGVRVYVPVSKIDLVQKYVGGSRTEPELSKLGGTSWANRKRRVEEAVLDLASEMIELQALRAAQPGFAFPPDSDWQREFEATFPYEETPDQLTTLVEIKSDMQRARPMDRLVCGDVGYGKTELAVRAAFKAIDNGKQVAVLVPTTVLAEQHYRTFGQRLAEYPFNVEVLSRFRSPGEQKRIAQRVAEGGVDIVIGTHRLVSADVKFKDLGLVIIDEEQRFGVEHKERLKRLRTTVDVLTLTATPIPRTLHLALLGIRDISNLETAPADRLPIETRIARFDTQLIRHAILRELNRDGQVYFVHNRVQDIKAVANKVQGIVPEAKIAIAHGQMAADELESAMVRFVTKQADVLVATTIIESGLDIPNANTIFINDADYYGLADLHQLRGRVGRHRNRAYAYLLLDPNRLVADTAAKRLKAIEEFTELGAGFKIALRDLEIRGAGNILGTQQSGHIAAVGYELYCQLLENAVRSLKKQPPRTPLEVTIDLPWPAYLPREYVPGQKLRIEVYRRLARLRDVRKLDDFRRELRDRYGPLPEPAEWLMRQAELRVLAARWQIHSVHRDGPDVILGYRSARLAARLEGQSEGRLRVVDGKSVYLRLQPGEDDPAVMYEFLRHLLRPPVQTAVPQGAQGI
jgi:transcription-repair coupling factor (superfamily II helicase)